MEGAFLAQRRHRRNKEQERERERERREKICVNYFFAKMKILLISRKKIIRESSNNKEPRERASVCGTNRESNV
jgi:hypothetical protein